MRFEPGRIDAECYHRCPVLLLVLPARACESTTLVLRALLCSGTLALFSLRIPLQQTLSFGCIQTQIRDICQYGQRCAYVGVLECRFKHVVLVNNRLVAVQTKQ